MKKMRMAGLLAVVLGGSTLGGCASLGVGESEFSCSGVPDGVGCMSAREVYERTEHPGPVRMSDVESHTADPRGAPAWMESGQSSGRPGAERAAPAGNPSGSAHPQLPQSTDPVPIRSPSKVMRIWVAPWEGETGDLMVSGLVYTEIEPRRWNIGVERPAEAPQLRPLQTRQSE